MVHRCSRHRLTRRADANGRLVDSVECIDDHLEMAPRPTNAEHETATEPDGNTEFWDRSTSTRHCALTGSSSTYPPVVDIRSSAARSLARMGGYDRSPDRTRLPRLKACPALQPRRSCGFGCNPEAVSAHPYPKSISRVLGIRVRILPQSTAVASSDNEPVVPPNHVERLPPVAHDASRRRRDNVSLSRRTGAEVPGVRLLSHVGGGDTSKRGMPNAQR